MPQETQAEKEGWPDWATERLNRQYMLMARISISDAPFSSSGDQRRLQFRPNNTTKTNAPKDIIRPATTPLPDIHLNRPKASRSVTEQKYASVSQKKFHDGQPSIYENPTLERIGILSPAKVYVDFIAKLDTGTEGNWISQRCLEELQIDVPQNSAELQTFQTFDGTKIESRKEVKMQWMFAKVRRPYINVFRVAEGRTPFSIILGSMFLLEEDLVNFKLKGNEPLLPFAREPLTEAEQKVIAEKQVQVEAENRNIAQEEEQKKALKRYLERTKKAQMSSGSIRS